MIDKISSLNIIKQNKRLQFRVIKLQANYIHMTLNSPLTVVALMNGMIGGVILVLPVTSYQVGYIYTIIAILIGGAFSFYSCYLSIKHLGDQKDMNYAMQAHFQSNIAKILYDIVVWLGLLFGSMFYYGLICIQWQSLTDKQSISIPLINAGVLFILIFVLKYFDFGASLMAYGIISIFSYLIFLIWVVASAPKGQVSWKPIGTNFFQFGATMSLAFAIQAFFIPVIMKNPLKKRHSLLLLIAYIIGACVYFYISLMGSFGIMNRSPLKSNPQTIEDYFEVGNVELRIIQSIYLVHLYSCLPQFVLISKKRLFNLFKISQTGKNKIPYKQGIYGFIFLGICVLIRLLGVKIDTIIAINGAIIGFFNIYFFPAILHIKCLYFSKNKKTFKQKQQQQLLKKQSLQLNEKKYYTLSDSGSQTNKDVSIELRDSFYNKQEILSAKSQIHQKINQSQNYSKSNTMKRQTSHKIKDDIQLLQTQYNPTNLNQIKDYFICQCQKSKSFIIRFIQMIIVLTMVAIGAVIMVNGIISVT